MRLLPLPPQVTSIISTGLDKSGLRRGVKWQSATDALFLDDARHINIHDLYSRKLGTVQEYHAHGADSWIKAEVGNLRPAQRFMRPAALQTFSHIFYNCVKNTSILFLHFIHN